MPSPYTCLVPTYEQALRNELESKMACAFAALNKN